MPDVIQKGHIIYLHANNEWYEYNELSQPLGAGAMGTVYLGRNCNTGEKVAIKRVVDSYADNPNIRQRAKLEASLMFRHRNLVQMLGYCELHPTRGPIFIISKLVQGINIDAFIKQFAKGSSKDAKKICEIFMPVFDALDYIHSKNVIHMDIKPSNIMVENGCNVILMDLGIACVDEKIKHEGPTHLTGTPKYSAPEQFGDKLNGTNKLTPQTDIYQTGVTLYELLTGKNPYAASDLETSKQKHKDVVLPASPAISKPVLKVLQKATSFYPSYRYDSIGDMRNELVAALNKKSFWPW